MSSSSSSSSSSQHLDLEVNDDYHCNLLRKPSHWKEMIQTYLPTIFVAWLGVMIYVYCAVNGGLVSIINNLNRVYNTHDLFTRMRGKPYLLRPFDDMFYPLMMEDGHIRRSLVVFTAGEKGLPNIDSLVKSWGSTHFDYVICHFDESQAEWHKLDWYNKAIGFYAHRQGKMWFFKRVITPWLASSYEYVHFSDADAGSPPEQPFDMWAYEQVLRQHKVILGQPAVTDKKKSSVYHICKQDKRQTMRWTTFVENGPLFSVNVPSGGFASLWEMVDSLAVTGYGVDLAWCPYLYEQKGFDRSRTCAVVDQHPIDHQDTHSATAQTYRDGRDYTNHGYEDWAWYRRIVGPMLLDWQQQMTLLRVP